MNRFVKVLGLAAGGLVALAAVAFLYVFIASERVAARTYDVPLSNFSARTDAEAVRRGERIATIVGCTNCHGAELQGVVFYDEPNIARITAPNLTKVVPEYSDAELARLLRHGVKRDGTAAWIMPSAMFSHLSDADLEAVIAYVRSKPARDGVAPEVTMRALGRVGVATKRFTPAVTEIEATRSRAAPDQADPISYGRYLVMNACTECHGQQLQGSEFLKAPSLLVAAAYSETDLANLLRNGVALGERKLGLMSKVSPARFATLTDDEIHAIRAYLSAFVQQGGAALP